MQAQGTEWDVGWGWGAEVGCPEDPEMVQALVSRKPDSSPCIQGFQVG